jgi:hypothetical protein
MKILCGISLGEYLDKYSILSIKLEKITDFQKRKEVEKEIQDYDKKIISDNLNFINKLYDVNLQSWENNDLRKKKIENDDLDEDFIQMSIKESKLNDQRYLIKREIDITSNSFYKEQKNYL